MDELMTVPEVAGHLRVAVKTIHQLLSRGQLPAIKIGRQWRFERAAIDNWVRQNSVGAKSNILVVDDEEVVRSLLKEILGNLGYRVMVAENGFDALQLVKQWAFDLVFLDLKIPALDGGEVLKEIRNIKPAQPVIVITGHPDSGVMARALAHAPSAVMQKPFGEKDVIAAVEGFLHGVEHGQRNSDSRLGTSESAGVPGAGRGDHGVIGQCHSLAE